MKKLANIIFAIGAAIVLTLLLVALFGGDKRPFPDAMIAFAYWEISSIYLAVGAIPMVISCMAVYKFNAVKLTAHKKRNAFFIFLPAIFPVACFLFWGAVIVIGYVNLFASWGK